MSALEDLQAWYRSQCDGDWEHNQGVTITTLDNPGWSVKIDLQDTLLESAPFPAFEDKQSDSRWIVCKVENAQFHGAGDPDRLGDILDAFTRWARARPDWLALPDPATLEHRDDKAFWTALGEEVGPERCQSEACARIRIRNSVYCRRHHYETIKHQPCPFPD